MRRRDAAVAAVCLVIAYFGLQGGRVPLLGLVDLGFHELGHLIAYGLDAVLPWSESLTAVAGSVLQVAVPVGLAAYFLWYRSDHFGGAFCLTWAATSAHDVARYIADAPYERLPLIWGEHDWAFLLRDDLGMADDLAYVVRSLGLVLLAGALLAAWWPTIEAATRRPPVRSV